MVGVVVEIRRYVDGSQPGWVECWLTDAEGHGWSFFEKVPVVTVEDLDARSPYPRRGFLACVVVRQKPDADGREVVVIDTSEPWGVESTTGMTRFAVRPEQLVEIDRVEDA